MMLVARHGTAAAWRSLAQPRPAVHAAAALVLVHTRGLTRGPEHVSAGRSAPDVQPAAAAQRPELGEYEQAVRVTMKAAAAQHRSDSGKARDSLDADILPRVRLERFLRRHHQPSASFSYTEHRDAPHLPPAEVVCSIRAAGRGAEGRGTSRFDATQQACHHWLEDYEKMHVTDKKTIAKRNPKARTPPAVYAPPDAPWHELPSKIKGQKAVKAPWLAPVPELAHGLSRVLQKDNTKATPIWEKLGGKPASAYVRTIVQPKDINWEAVAPFTPPSFDDTLHNLAVKHKVKYKASTSSITGLLSHVYQIISNYRPADTSGLSAAFRDQPNSFSYTVPKRPVSVLLSNNNEN